jgi:hypothetical protein
MTSVSQGIQLAIVVFMSSLLLACGSSDSTAPVEESPDEITGEPEQPNPDNETDPTDPDSTPLEATYRATFTATWSADTHPVNFPVNPHFSPLVGAIHSEQAIFWELGQIASPGIEQMAESGGTSLLLDEIQDVIDEGRALLSVSGGGIGTSPGSVDVEFTVSRDYPLVTLVSMLAPSPDWFIGVDSLSMLDGQGSFLPELSVDLKLYDSGTDSGSRFDADNMDTQPPSPIEAVTTDSAETNFVNGEPFVGSLLFEKIR